MNQNINYQQLNDEIQKLREGNYTSYQKFYDMTSDYLYQILISDVKNPDVANELINELYMDIYANINAELADNSRFFEWAGNKARDLSTAYLMAHNIPESDGSDAGAGMAPRAAKTGMSLGAKLTIGIIAAIVIVVAGIIALRVFHSDNKDNETTTEIVSGQDGATDEVSENADATTEQMTATDENTAQYMAYYEVVKNSIQEHPASVKYSVESLSYISGLWNVQLVDLDGDSDEELIIAYTENEYQQINYSNTIEVYDYIEGEAALVGSYTTELKSNQTDILDFYYALEPVDDGRNLLWVHQEEFLGNSFGDRIYTYECYEYAEGSLSQIHNYWYSTEKDVNGEIDGEKNDKSTCATLMKEIDESEYDFYYNVDNELSDCTIKYAINKSLLVKHRTIKKLAEASGDDTYSTDEELLSSWLKPGDTTLAIINNQYNEVIMINDPQRIYSDYDMSGGKAELSADSQSVHFKLNPSFGYRYVESLELDFYATYVEGVLLVVGGVDDYLILDENGNNHTPVEYYFWLDVDDYLVNNPADDLTPALEASNYEVTQEVFNENAGNLMNR